MPTLDPHTIGARLEYLRVARGLSQRELSRQVKIAQSAISDFEAGKRLPSTKALAKFLTFFDIPASDLMSPGEIDRTQSKRHFLIKLIDDRLNGLKVEELEFVVQFIDRVFLPRHRDSNPAPADLDSPELSTK